MKAKLIPVILSGGAGTRLWPLSRRLYPKQFIPLFGNRSLFTRTLERILPLQSQHLIVVCNEAHRFMVTEYLREMKIRNCTVIAEPEPRNTAPAIALAAFWIQRHLGNMPMLVLPSDHYMKEENFSRYITDELVAAAGDSFITFGIKPTRAETGYGYIQTKNERSTGDGKNLQSDIRLIDVYKFTEKPDKNTAEAYLKTKFHYWNSGIFLFNSDCYLSALKDYQGHIFDTCSQALDKAQDAMIDDYNIINPNTKYFKQSPDISIDYAIMERVPNIRLCPLNTRWSDLGSWEALAEAQNTDAQGNTISGEGDIVAEDSNNNIIYADNKLVACLGVNDYLIAETKDAILVADRTRSQEVKLLVGKLRSNGYTESDLHAKVYRPWGSYESIDQGKNFQVKRIIVKPGQRLSLQSHRRRAEHWVVVAGKAKVTLNDKMFNLRENESVHIPVGAKHRLENEQTEPLHLIEVQCGDYLGEDDIERYEDNYGRADER